MASGVSDCTRRDAVIRTRQLASVVSNDPSTHACPGRLDPAHRRAARHPATSRASSPRDEIAPHADAWDREAYFDRGIVEKLGALGFLGMMIPEEYDGLGLDTLHLSRRARGDRGGRRVGRGADERAQLAADADDAALRHRRAEGAIPQADGARRDARRVRAVASRTRAPTRRRSPTQADARRRRLGAQRARRAWVTTGSARRRRSSHGAHRHRLPTRTRRARHQRVHRDARPPGLPRRQEGRQDGPARVADRAARLRRHARAGRKPARRGGAWASSTRCSRSTTAGSASPRRRSASRSAALEHALDVRRRAQAVRQADQGIPGDPVQARRHGDARHRLDARRCCTRPRPRRIAAKPSRSSARWPS